MHNLNPDIVGVTESWTCDSIVDAELELEGYNVFRKDRPTDNRGGGVLLYVRRSLAAYEVQQKTEFPEHIWCRLMTAGGSELLIGVCYRTTSESIFGKDYQSLLNDLFVEVNKKNVLIMGDFNYGDIDWPNHRLLPSASLDSRQFFECIDDNFYIQHVLQPTRDDSILDLVFSLESDLISDMRVIDNLATSDHNMLIWNIHTDARVKSQMLPKITFDYSKARFDKINRELLAVDWNSVLGGGTCEMWNIFKGILQSLETKYVPKKTEMLQGNINQCG